VFGNQTSIVTACFSRSSGKFTALNPTPGSLLLMRRLLHTTLTLLNAMATLAQTGASLKCEPLLTTGYKTPAAMGKAIML